MGKLNSGFLSCTPDQRGHSGLSARGLPSLAGQRRRLPAAAPNEEAFPAFRGKRQNMLCDGRQSACGRLQDLSNEALTVSLEVSPLVFCCPVSQATVLLLSSSSAVTRVKVGHDLADRWNAVRRGLGMSSIDASTGAAPIDIGAASRRFQRPPTARVVGRCFLGVRRRYSWSGHHCRAGGLSATSLLYRINIWTAVMCCASLAGLRI